MNANWNPTTEGDEAHLEVSLAAGGVVGRQGVVVPRRGIRKRGGLS